MPSFLALGALFGVAILALFPDGALLPAPARLSEKSALIFLLITFLIALLPKLQRRLLENRDAAIWLLISAGFVLFHIAERAGPREGWSLRVAALPDDAFAVSYALRIAVLGAILSVPAWIRGGGPQKAIFAALLLIGVLGIGTFTFLARFYNVGVTETLDPTPLPTLFLQILGYGSVAALCRAITSSEKTTRLALRLMPLFLLLVWAKLQFVAVPVEAEDAE
jgi:hypothetical protein